MDMHVHNIRLLTIGGTHLWNENTDEIEKLLMENGIYGTKKPANGIYLYEVDTEKTDTNDIYKWSEIDINDSETFCWRDYVFFIGNNGEHWLNFPKDENHYNILKLILESKP